MRVAPQKKHKKIIYKYIDLHMPVTRKGAGGAIASARVRFSGRTTMRGEDGGTYKHGVRESRRNTSSRVQSARKAHQEHEKTVRDAETRELLGRPSSSRKRPACRAKDERCGGG
jgi:hypothetical protein